MDDRMLAAVDPDRTPRSSTSPSCTTWPLTPRWASAAALASSHTTWASGLRSSSALQPVDIEMVLVDVGDQHAGQPGECLKAARKAARVDQQPRLCLFDEQAAMAELLQPHSPTLQAAACGGAGAVARARAASRSRRSRAWPRPRHHGWLLGHPDSLNAGQQLKRRRVLVRS